MVRKITRPSTLRDPLMVNRVPLGTETPGGILPYFELLGASREKLTVTHSKDGFLRELVPKVIQICGRSSD